MQGRARVAERRLSAHRLFYPAAAAYAAIALPAAALAMAGWANPVRALADPLGHAHEMLLGFALAVVAGNQLGAVPRAWLVAAFALWVGGRAVFLLAPSSSFAAATNAAFAALLAMQVAPRLFRSAKKLRNQALPATITALGIAAVAWQVSRFAAPGGTALAVRVTVLLFAILMLFMGGRVIAPALAGQLYRQGERLDARVQPRVEAALMLLSVVAVAGFAAPGMRLLSASCLVLAGVLAAVRLIRWRVWALRGRLDLLCLAAGYAWLALGLASFGIALALERFETVALHIVTVGALGTLTLNVMAQSWLVKARSQSIGSREIVAGTALLAIATFFRVLAFWHGPAWFVAAAAGWSASFILLLRLFWRAK